MFRLFELPPELIPLIFECIAHSREFKRVMRLRLVSHQFKSFIEDTIIRHRLLQGVWGIPGPIDSRPSDIHGRAFILEYLAHRAWMEKNPASHLGRIRYAAVALSQTQPNDDFILDEEIDMDAVFPRLRALVRLALGHPLWKGQQRKLLAADDTHANADADANSEAAEKRDKRPPTVVSPAKRQADVCVAAVYLGDISYVENLIAQGRQFCTHGGIRDVESGIFGPAFKAAAFRGDVAMLRLLISSNPHCRLPDGTPPSYMRRQILKTASLGGHKDTFDFALTLSPLPLGMSKQDIIEGRLWYDYQNLKDAIASTPHPDNYRRGLALFVPGRKMLNMRGNWDLQTQLARKAAAGHLDMVRFHLDHGSMSCFHDAEKQGLEQLQESPGPLLSRALVQASASGSVDIVKLLLERGADPNCAYIPNSSLCTNTDTAVGASTPLMAAARHGFLAMVGLLLDAGAEVNQGHPPPIVMAVFKEDMDLFRLLRQRGARLDTPETGGWAMAVARFYQLESLMDLLVQEGVGLNTVLHRCAGPHERRQMDWLFPKKLYATSTTVE